MDKILVDIIWVNVPINIIEGSLVFVVGFGAAFMAGWYFTKLLKR